MRRRPSQPTRRRLTHKQGLNRTPRGGDASARRAPGSRVHVFSNATALASQRFDLSGPCALRHSSNDSEPSPRHDVPWQPVSRVTPKGRRHRSTTDGRPQRRRPLTARLFRSEPPELQAAHRCRSAASLSPAPITRHGLSAAHPAHNAGRARRVAPPFSTAGAVEASVTCPLLADWARCG